MHFLREIYGPNGAGNWLSFLYVWQVSFTAPLSIASGCIGLSSFLAWFWPGLDRAPIAALPALHYSNFAAAAACLLVTALLYRNLSSITRLAWVLFAGVLAAIAGVIVSGFAHAAARRLADARLARAAAEPGAGRAGAGHAADDLLLLGLLQHLLPGRRGAAAGADDSARHSALGALRLGVLCGHEPGRAALHARRRGARQPPAQRFACNWWPTSPAPPLAAVAGRLMAALIIWTAFASVFSLLLGYSRVPYAAARDGNYFRFLAAVHPKHGIPHRSLVALGVVAACFCFFSLAQVITMLVITRILLQFFLQQVGVMLLRAQRPELARPFKMPLYPLPPLVAMARLYLPVGQPQPRAGGLGRCRRHCRFRHADLFVPRAAAGAVAVRAGFMNEAGSRFPAFAYDHKRKCVKPQTDFGPDKTPYLTRTFGSTESPGLSS